MSDEQESRSEHTFEEQIAADLDWHRSEIDPRENEETTPPDDEHIETCCIWVTECYPPSHATLTTVPLVSLIRPVRLKTFEILSGDAPIREVLERI